jgi:hypothetical protein
MFSFNDNIKPQFSQEDLYYLNQYELGSEALQLDFFNKLKDLLMKKEDVNMMAKKQPEDKEKFKIFPDWKLFCKKISISKITHQRRNTLQNHLAPETMPQMEMLVELGLFYRLGHTASHNLVKGETSPDDRWRWFCVLERNNKNIDFRGTIDHSFEGCQFIYNEIKKNLIISDLNKGTWDFTSPLRNVLGHFEKDIKPWIIWGNMGGEKLENQIIPSNVWKHIENEYKNFKLGRCKKEEAASNIEQRIFHEKNK